MFEPGQFLNPVFENQEHHTDKGRDDTFHVTEGPGAPF